MTVGPADPLSARSHEALGAAQAVGNPRASGGPVGLPWPPAAEKVRAAAVARAADARRGLGRAAAGRPAAGHTLCSALGGPIGSATARVSLLARRLGPFSVNQRTLSEPADQVLRIPTKPRYCNGFAV